MSAIRHKAPTLTADAVSKEDQGWFDVEASAESNERKEEPSPQENPPIEPPDNDNLCFGAYWLRTH